MTYIDEVYERIDEIFDPREPDATIISRIKALVSDEMRKSYANGARAGRSEQFKRKLGTAGPLKKGKSA